MAKSLRAGQGELRLVRPKSGMRRPETAKQTRLGVLGEKGDETDTLQAQNLSECLALKQISSFTLTGRSSGRRWRGMVRLKTGQRTAFSNQFRPRPCARSWSDDDRGWTSSELVRGPCPPTTSDPVHFRASISVLLQKALFGRHELIGTGQRRRIHLAQCRCLVIALPRRLTPCIAVSLSLLL